MATGTIKKTSKDRLILTIPANTYSTQGEALAAVNPAYQALSAEEKRNCYIQVRQGIYNIQHLSYGKFITVFPYSNRVNIYSISVVEGTTYEYSISPSGITQIDQTSLSQDYSINLYVRAN